ncbi:TrbG/VirB9 family P-type conjugative transfer protein [Legionella quinlivanii]|uniref:TrbG/VirB9 family P-type conjugative transfer protein n=1 Tax=Legionella quinlivanii TaxID=45073 RepID=UPI001559806C|nr:TrbG/VirB9 family P-type conjugative transfer protein [Legionella quinlivanii]
MKRLIMTGLLLAHTLAFGQQLPQSTKQDARVTLVPFQEHNVVKLKARTFTNTQILFNRNETILVVEGGDNAGWMVTFHEHLPYMVFVKPALFNSDTNMTVVTDKHNYYFQITSNKSIDSDSVKPIYALQFTYPKEEKAKLEAARKAAVLRNASLNKQHKDPKTLNWNYRFSGRAELTPQHVYDDGQFTYFEFSPTQPVPAVFAVDNKQGKESIVNTRRQGHLLIIQRLAPPVHLAKRWLGGLHL